MKNLLIVLPVLLLCISCTKIDNVDEFENEPYIFLTKTELIGKWVSTHEEGDKVKDSLYFTEDSLIINRGGNLEEFFFRGINENGELLIIYDQTMEGNKIIPLKYYPELEVLQLEGLFVSSLELSIERFKKL